MLRPQTLRAARRLHVRLACFFTPLLLFYTVTGSAQLFALHVDTKDGYRPPTLLRVLGNLHVRQHPESDAAAPPVSAPFRYLSLAMCVGMGTTMGLGMLLAGASASAGEGWPLFAAGASIPALALLLSAWFG